MVTTEKFRTLSLQFPNVEEKPHFDTTSFQIGGKIFASLEIEKSKACLKLNVDEQTEFCKMDKAIYPVDNHFGKNGWTYINIDKIREELLIETLETTFKIVKKTKNEETNSIPNNL